MNHKNVFMPYAQGGPIENNTSRGLAILPGKNYLLLDLFIDMVNVKLGSSYTIAKPNRADRVEVDIQQSWYPQHYTCYPYAGRSAE